MALRTAGYRGIRDIDYDRDGELWKVEALDPTGDDVEVGVDALTGRIVYVEED